MKIITLAFALTSVLFVHAPKANAHATGKRGTVEVIGQAVKAVAAGPVLIHGYSGFSGGAIFVAPVIAGNDADCSTALAQGGVRTMPLIADRVALVPVGAGQVACLATNTERPFELLWHALAAEGAETAWAAAKAHTATR